MNIYEYQYPEPGQPAIDPNIAPKKPEETWGPNHPYDDPECGWKCMGQKFFFTNFQILDPCNEIH